MIYITIELEVDEDGDASEIAESVKSNIQDTLGHCPYSIEMVDVDWVVAK